MKNYSLAQFWYQRAATEKHNIEAHYELGVMYLDGIGVSVDYKKSFENFSSAAQRGDSVSSDMCEEFRSGELLVFLLAQEWPVSYFYLNENCKVALNEIFFITTELYFPIPKELLYIIFKLLIKMWPREQPHLPYNQ